MACPPPGRTRGRPNGSVRPVTCEGRRGVVCKSVLSQNFAERLVHGNELLREADPDYNLKISRENPGYTVEAVRSALEHVHPPRESSDLEWMSGFDVWSGYLVLDAWVAGRDRHHENWAVIDRADGRALSPSFDHGNALGFQVSDSEAAKLVANAPRLERWAERGRSHHFAQKPTLVRLAREAISACNEHVGAYWLQRLQELPSEAIEKTIAVIPGDIMSDPSRRFVLSLLELNRRRLTDDD